MTMRRIFEEVGSYVQGKELIVCFLLTILFLFLSFVGYTKLSTTEITEITGITHTIHISYYGFPFQMVGILNPLTETENYWVYHSREGLFRIIWGGFLLNFVLYFLLALILVFSFRRLKAEKL